MHWSTKSTISSAEIRASEERDDKSVREREAMCKGRSALDKQKLSWNPPKMENKGSRLCLLYETEAAHPKIVIPIPISCLPFSLNAKCRDNVSCEILSYLLAQNEEC